MAASLPDEVWRKILDMGLQNSKFSYRDLCCISIASRRLNRLSNEDTLWTALLNLDYPPTSTSALPPSNIKTLYKSRFERDKQCRFAAHKRALLRNQSQVSLHSINLKHLRLKLMEENQLMKAKAQELSNLHNQRRASVAMKVWQPEIVRDRQKRMVEQSVVPVEFRISAVEMELRLCRQQIEVFNKSLNDEESRLNAEKKQLAMLKYHPFQDDHSAGTGVNKRSIELKKLKQCSKRLCSSRAKDTGDW